MIGERTSEGLEIRLRIRERTRFLGAAFLAVWLCLWAMGECFALWILVRGAIALVTGTPPDPGRAPLHAGPAVLVGAFLVAWLSIWSLGGLAAGSELLRLLWGLDRIIVDGGGLQVRWERAPFHTSRRFERGTIRGITLSEPRGHIVVVSGTERVELSGLGTRAERRDAVAALNAALPLPAAHAPTAVVLPGRWADIITPEGARALVPDLATRRRQARFTTVLAMLGAASTYVVARDAVRDPHLAVGAIVAASLTALLACSAWWLARGRSEWRLGSGDLVLCRRFGSHVRERFTAHRLVLDSSTDSDGDHWYQLFAVGDLPAAAPASAPPAWRVGRPPNSRSVVRLMNQPEVVRDLAAWLSAHADIPLDDRTTADARALALTELRDALVKSGRFGKWVSKHVDRLADTIDGD